MSDLIEVGYIANSRRKGVVHQIVNGKPKCGCVVFTRPLVPVHVDFTVIEHQRVTKIADPQVQIDFAATVNCKKCLGIVKKREKAPQPAVEATPFAS